MTSVAPAPAEAPEADHYQAANRRFLAALGVATHGMSPISLYEAWLDWWLHLAVAPGKQAQIGVKAIEKWVRLRRYLGECALKGECAERCIVPLAQDRRFDDPAWCRFPFNLMSQSFLLSQQWWHNTTTHVPGVTARHARLVDFYSRQFLDMLSPSNFPFTNPVVIERTAEAGGTNLVRGFGRFVADAAKALAGTNGAADSDFKVGANLAVTPGAVIFRNELIELIQYRPTTGKVRPEPVLIVPAWIMKYYILDLQQHNSMIRYLVDQGFTVFCISWRNPGPEMRETSLDDYRRLGVMAALEAVQSVTASPKVHAVGYCLGGTLLTIAAAAMARDGDKRLATVSLFAAQVDFEEPGEIGLFIDESQVTFLEGVMSASGYLDQRQMAGTFRMLRSQDLVWSRLVSEYLMGDSQPMTDLMTWNADATRMPYRMHSQYLRQLFLNNDLAQARYMVDGRRIHVEDIDVPVFAVGTVTDHVAPWRSVFKLTHLLDTDVDFVLTSGGHNAGIVSEPGHPNRSFRRLEYRHGEPHADPDTWLHGARQEEGSWWPAWAEWLAARSEEPMELPTMGSRACPPLCEAPGTYVLQP
ncbi:MAG: poly-beta-hydroxybutyrate polymerase [Alphaproteobacteria bacterium]|nr:MAG: poly-beta-hydroxybutyrate polymerase [Alphaproteobacteria bacterium]